MKCSKVQHYAVEHAGESFPADYVAHLASCPECRRVHERAQVVHHLVALKKYEQPGAGFEARNLAATMRRIRNLDQEPAAGWSVWDWLAMPHPVLRYSAAAVVAALVGFNVYVGLRTSTSSPSAAEETTIESETIAAASTVAPAPVTLPQFVAAPRAATPSQDVFAVAASNRPIESGGVRYGPGPSVPVGFDY